MADLKINQLDPIIPMSAGSGANYAALSDADLFIVKMKVRGTAIGDEDRKLTWLELRNSLNLSQYMGTAGGNFTGDVTLNNNKAIKSQQSGAGADIQMLYVDTANRVNIGATTNLTRLLSSGIPQLVDGTGAYNIITAKNLPAPGSLSGGGAYTKTETDQADLLKFDKAGGDISGDINLTTNAKRLYGVTTDGMKVSLAYVTEGNSVNFGHSTLHTNLVSTDIPNWVQGGNSYAIITKGNLPVPGDINAYTKTEVDSKLDTKLDKAGGEVSGNLTLAKDKALLVREFDNSSRIGLMASTASGNLQIGDPGASFTVRIKSYNNPTIAINGDSTDYPIYHAGNKPSVAALGLTDTVAKAASALQDGSFGIGTIPNHVKDNAFLVLNDKTQFFAQDGGSTEQAFGAAGVGTHMFYGAVGTGIATQYRSGTLFLTQDNKLMSQWANLDYTGKSLSTLTATYFSDQNPPTASQVGAYSVTDADGRFARKGVNADITALNSLTGALKVGADGTDDLHVATVRQLRIATGATAGAIVGVVGGFVGAVMWFNGPRDRVPAGWLPADGQTLKRTDAPDLWSAVAAGSYANVSEALWQNSGEASDPGQMSNATNRAKYSLGDGSTTFRLPDLNGGQTGTIANAFLRGYGTGGDQTKIGSMALDGAPNLTGRIGSANNGMSWLDVTVADGVFATATPVSNSFKPSQQDLASGRNSIWTFDASRAFSGYGRSTTEIRPRAAVGIWIIRVSNNFEAANTNFSVNNGAATLPASGTATVGGSWQSVYSVGGVQDHAVSLKSFRNVGGLSSAQLTVTQQAQGSQIFKSSTLAFNADGLLTVPGAGQFGGTVLARQTVEPSDTSIGAYLNTPELRTGFKSRGNIPGVTDFGYVSFYGQEHVGDSFAAIVQLNGYGQNRAWYFKQNGEFNSPGAVIADSVVGNTTDYSFVANGATSAGSGTYVTRVMRAFISGAQRSEMDVYNSGQDIQSRLIAYNGGAYNVLWVGAGGSTGDNRGVFQAGGSDIKLKDNVTDSVDGASDRIMSIRTREFDWKHDGRHDRGWIAQELEKVDKTYVFEENGIKNVSSNAIIADLISTVQDLMAQVAELKAAQS